MLLILSLIFTVFVVLFLVLNPVLGISLLFISKPIIDTTFQESVFFGFRLTEIISVLFPLIGLGYILLSQSIYSIRHMPLKYIWFIYGLDILIFSLMIAFTDSLLNGANIFFRYLNGFIAFYMVQAFFHPGKGKGFKIFLIALIIAGLFPVGVGLYQAVTGKVWIKAQAEGIARLVGLYHDAFTVRFYALQTILALILYNTLYLKKNIFKQIGTFFYMLISFIVMVKAFSKSGFLTISLWFFSWQILQKRIIRVLLFSGFLTILGMFYFTDTVGKIGQLFHKEIGAIEGTGKTQLILQGRLFLWKDEMLKWAHFDLGKKVIGTGVANLGLHNDYLQILFHGGLIGLFIYLSLLIGIGYKITANLRAKVDPISIAALMLFLMWLVDSVGLVPSAYPEYQWLVFGIIALSFRLRQEENTLLKTADNSIANGINNFSGKSLETLDQNPQSSKKRRYPIIDAQC